MPLNPPKTAEFLKQTSSLLNEHIRREQESLRLYRPLKTTESFHKSEVFERIIRGGNQCLGGEQEIYDPVLDCHRRIDQIDSEFHVLSRNMKTGEIEAQKASRPFVKGYGALYEVAFSNGDHIIASAEHRILAATGQWVSVREAAASGVALLSVESECCSPQGIATAKRGQHYNMQPIPQASFAGKGCVRPGEAAIGSSVPAYHPSGVKCYCDGDSSPLPSPRTQPSMQSRLSLAGPLSTISSSLRSAETSPYEAQGRRGCLPFLEVSMRGICQPDSSLGGDRYSEKAGGCPGCYCLDCRLCDGPPRPSSGCGRDVAPSRGGVLGRSNHSRLGGLTRNGTRTRVDRRVCHLSSFWTSYRNGHHPCEAVCRFGPYNAAWSQQSIRSGRQSPLLLGRRSGTSPVSSLGGATPSSFSFWSEATGTTVVHVIAIKPLRQDWIWDITVEEYHNYMVGGLIHRNSSKTTSCAVEFASIMTGIPITGNDGKAMPYLFPTNRKLVGWIIGYDENHIGRVIHKVLFKPGAFEIIRDEKTGKWRPWQPWREEDLRREAEHVPAPPLIPERMIRSMGWNDKKIGAFSIAELTNDNEIWAFSSKSMAGQGSVVDAIWIDEDIEYPKHVNEWRMRLSKRSHSKLFWSAWPHSKNEALVEMSKRAEDERLNPRPFVKEWLLRYSDNPYIPAMQKKKVLAGYSEAERRARDLGEFMHDAVRVFPSFHVDIHGVGGPGREPDQLDRYLRKRHYQVPVDWTHYLVVDPGHTQPAVLFAAVPPPWLGNHVVVFDEIYTPRISAEEMAQEVFRKSQGRYYEVFLMDPRAGKQTPMGLGVGNTIRHIYSTAFTNARLESRQSDSSFIFGSDNISMRNMLVRQWLDPRPDGTIRFRIIKDRVPNLIREFSLYKKKIVRDSAKDDVVDKDNHLMDSLGYLASYPVEYVAPEMFSSRRHPIWDHIDKREKPKKKGGEETIHLGAGTPSQEHVPTYV